MAPNNPVKFMGKLYKGFDKRDNENRRWTVDDLKTLDLQGTPVCYEHDIKLELGKIVRNWVDKNGWLWVEGKLHNAKKLGENRFNDIRNLLLKDKLKDLSIHWIGCEDSSGIVDPKSKQVIEVSLTTEGKYKGTHLYSIQASKNSKSEVKHFIEYIGIKPTTNLINLGNINTRPKMTAYSDSPNEITQFIKEHQDAFTEEELEKIGSPNVDFTTKAAIVMKKMSEARTQPQGGHTSSNDSLTRKEIEEEIKREYESELQEAKAKLSKYDEGYKIEQGRIASELFEKVKGAFGNETEEYQKAYMQFVQSPETSGPWKLLKSLSQHAAEQSQRAQDAETNSAKYKRDRTNYAKKLEDMQQQISQKQHHQQQQQEKEQQQQQQQTQLAAEAASKKGVSGFYSKQSSELNTGEKASRSSNRDHPYNSSKTSGILQTDEDFVNALKRLASETKLGPPPTVNFEPGTKWASVNFSNRSFGFGN